MIETRYFSAGSGVRRVPCGGPGWREPGAEGWRFLPSLAGGAFELPASPDDQHASHRDRLLVWQLQTHRTSTLHLAEASVSGGQIGAAVAIELDGHAFAGLAFAASPRGDVALHLLFSDKTAAQLRLPRPTAGHGAAASAGLLDAVHPGSLQLLPLAPQLAALGVPAALAVVGGHLVVAGASDTVACVPLGAFDTADPTAASHLVTSTSLLQRLVGSLYQPVARNGVVAALAAADAAGRPLLALVHDSAALRLWSAPPAAQLLASHELLPGAAARALSPRAALAAGGVPPGELLIVSQLEAPDAPGTATLAACHVRVAEAGTDGGAGDGGAALARFALQLPAVSARLLGAQLRGSELLVLAAVPGGETRLMAFSARDGSYLGGAQLLSKGPNADWGIEEDLWAATLATFSSACTPEDSVCGQLLVPGQLCRTALREALLFWGAALEQEQVDAASYDQLRVYLRAALLSVAARHPAYTEARCWHALFARYCECWQQQHPPLALASSGSGAWLGVVRGGLLMSLLRPGTPLEDAGGEAGGAAAGGHGGEAIRAALRAIGQALGSPALRLMMRLVAGGVDLEGTLLPGMVDLLLYGPARAETDLGGAGGGDAARRRLTEWRAARQVALLHIQQALDALPDPVAAISEFADELLLASDGVVAAPAGAAGPGQAPQLPASLGAVLCSSVLQAARARCLAAQRLLLLLGVMQRMGRAGSQSLSAEQAKAIRERLAPQLATALRASAMALWLAKTPAACPLGAGTAAGAAAAVLPQHLEALQLGGPTRGGMPGTPRTPGGAAGSAAAGALAPQRGQRAALMQPMAVHLLQGFCEACRAEAAAALGGLVGPAVAALLAYLCAGADAAKAAPRGGPAPPGIETRALHVGWRLFSAREFAGVGALVELAGGTAPSDAGLAFLLGVSLACRLRGFGGPGPAGDAARRELLDAASGHLFRAAAGLAAPEAAPLRAVLQQLRRRQQRGGVGGGGAALDIAPPSSSDGGGGALGGGASGVPPEAVPRLRLEFFEAVMRLFESEECLEGALEFARAALGAVDGAYAPDDAARRERQGQLWLAVFTYASRLGRYAEAYTAASANPVPGHRLECVRRLVHRLAEERRLDVLCGLPFAGVVAPEPSAADPAPAPVPLARVAVDVLTRRAQHSSLGGPSGRGSAPRGAAYTALHDFLVCWGDYRGAAAAVLGLAWRLRAEAAQSEESLREVEDAYAEAVNQLELLDPADAWLDTAHPLLADASPTALAGEDADGADGEGDEASLADGLGLESVGGDDGAGEAALARQLAAARRQRREAAGGAARGVVTLPALRREAALFAAAASLVDSLPGLAVLRAPALAPDYVFDQTLAAGRLGEAEALAHALWRGGALEERLERLAAAAAARCVRVQVGGGGADAAAAAAAAALDEGPGEDGAWDDEASAASASAGGRLGYLGCPAAGAWQRLRVLLSRYDSSGRRRLAGRLRLAAIDAALAEAPAATLPAWLLAPFAPGGCEGAMAGGPDDAAALLRVYVRRGRLEDAGQLALDHLAAWGAANPLARTKPAASWVPLRALEGLDAVLGEAAADSGGGGGERLAALKQQLRSAVGEHLALGARDSRMAAAGAGGSASAMAIG